MASEKKLNILGISIDRVSMDEAVAGFLNYLNREGCHIIVTPNSEILERASKNPRLAGIINSADMVIPDGIGLVYASKFLGKPLEERVTGIDFLSRAFSVLAERKMSVFLLGGKSEEKDLRSVAEEAGENITRNYPDLKIAGFHHGYFKKEDEANIVAMINASGADFLCVALGSPKQEEFMADYKEKLLCKAAIGVGGSLDVLAGRVTRAPEFYQKYGLEWLYRAVKEPARFVRLSALPIFIFKVIGWKIRGGN